VPKAVGVAVALLVCGHWMLNTMLSFTRQLFDSIPQLLG
jgi:flagellar biosynthetic protein FliQ